MEERPAKPPEPKPSAPKPAASQPPAQNPPVSEPNDQSLKDQKRTAPKPTAPKPAVSKPTAPKPAVPKSVSSKAAAPKATAAKAATVKKKPGKRSFPSLIIATTIAIGIVAGLGFSQIARLQIIHNETQEQLAGAIEQVAKLNAQIATQQVTIAGLSEALQALQGGRISTLEQQYIDAASARLEATVAREVAALGTSGFRYNMVEFDRRSCSLGGTFSGELPDGFRQEEEFEPNQMVEVQESGEDVRGIPFYRVTISGKALRWEGDTALFRHGSMRIECQ